MSVPRRVLVMLMIGNDDYTREPAINDGVEATCIFVFTTQAVE